MEVYSSVLICLKSNLGFVQIHATLQLLVGSSHMLLKLNLGFVLIE